MKTLGMKRRRFLHAAGIGLSGLVACTPDTPSFRGVNVTGARYGRDFALRDPDGQLRRLADFKGRVVLLFFGFTQCPDVCPTALTRAAAVRQMLGAQADALQVIFVSIDPERDTPELLRSYTTAFHPSFLGLSSDVAGTARVAEEFKIFYTKVPTGSSYTMDHTALSYLIDPQGHLRVAVRHEQSAADLAADIELLLRSV